MLNHITIMGRMTRDPELRRTSSGTAVASFTLAVDEDRTNSATGNRDADFIDCVAWASAAEFVSKYFCKGQMAVVSGRLKIRDWTDKDGSKRKRPEIKTEHIYFGEGKKQDSGFGSGYNARSIAEANPGGDCCMSLEDDDSELPF